MHSALINLHTLAGAGSSRSCVCSVVGQRWPSHQSSKVLGDAHLPLLLQRLGFAVAVLHGSRPQNKAGRSSATSSDAAVAQVLALTALDLTDCREYHHSDSLASVCFKPI